MRKNTALLGAMVLAGAVFTSAQAQGPRPLTRVTLKNDVGIELLGKALLYSFGYQRTVSPSFGLEVGLGGFGGGGDGTSEAVVFITASAKLYIITKDCCLYLTGGGVIVTGTTDTGPFSDNATDAYGLAGLGFEMRSQGGFTFRITAYTLFGGGGWFVWPGLGLGYAF
jgi:hypothetical protein